jgi:hypothetical protein
MTTHHHGQLPDFSALLAGPTPSDVVESTGGDNQTNYCEDENNSSADHLDTNAHLSSACLIFRRVMILLSFTTLLCSIFWSNGYH